MVLLAPTETFLALSQAEVLGLVFSCVIYTNDSMLCKYQCCKELKHNHDEGTQFTGNLNYSCFLSLYNIFSIVSGAGFQSPSFLLFLALDNYKLNKIADNIANVCIFSNFSVAISSLPITLAQETASF